MRSLGLSIVCSLAVAVGALTWTELPVAPSADVQDKSAAPLAAAMSAAAAVPANAQTPSHPTAPSTVSLSLPGLVVASRRAQVRVGIDGVIASAPTQPGDCLADGAPLFVVDDTTIRAQVAEQTERIAAAGDAIAQASADCDFLASQHEVDRTLYAQRAISASQWLQGRYKLEAARARLSELRHVLAQEQHKLAVLEQKQRDHRVLAPFAGRVTHTLRYAHQFAVAGDVVLWMESLENHLKVQVPDGLVAEADNLRFQVFVQRQWHSLPVVRWESKFNADGSRTVLLDLPADLALCSGQIVQVHVERQEIAP